MSRLIRRQNVDSNAFLGHLTRPDKAQHVVLPLPSSLLFTGRILMMVSHPQTTVFLPSNVVRLGPASYWEEGRGRDGREGKGEEVGLGWQKWLGYTVGLFPPT